MKQFLLLLIVFLFAVIRIPAQPLLKAKELLTANKLIEAKTAIDEVLMQAANQKNADAFYIKAKIYNAISLDAAVSKQFPLARMDAFKALKKYTELDALDLAAFKIDSYKPINDIYTAWYQNAANSFNAKQYSQAYEMFTNALQASSFMNDKGLITTKLDTNSVLYAGVSAEKLNHLEDAAKHYSHLVEAKVKGAGFVEIYKWVTNYYYEKKNASQAMKYLLTGREIYPEDPFWNSLELDMVRDKGNKQELFAAYEKVITASPGNHLYHYNYAIELYQLAYNIDPAKRPVNSEELIQKSLLHLVKVLELTPAYTRAQLFAGQIYYNMGVDLLEKAKALKGIGTDELKVNTIAKFDQALPYFLSVEQILEPQAKLKAEDKTDLKEAYDLMITIYSQKKLESKVKEYEAKFNNVDVKH